MGEGRGLAAQPLSTSNLASPSSSKTGGPNQTASGTRGGGSSSARRDGRDSESEAARHPLGGGVSLQLTLGLALVQLFTIAAGWATFKLSRIVRRQREQLQQVKGELSSASALLDSRARDLAAAREQVAANAAMAQEMRAVKADLATTKTQADSVGHDLLVASTRFREATTYLERAMSDLSTTQEQLQTAKRDFKHASDELWATRAALDDARGEMGLTKSQLEGMRGELDRTKRLLAQAESQLQQAKLEARRRNYDDGDDTYDA